MPRVKPPRTVEKGLWEKPTVLNNVETYANVPKIILQGADWFRTIGTEGSPGNQNVLPDRCDRKYRSYRSTNGNRFVILFMISAADSRAEQL